MFCPHPITLKNGECVPCGKCPSCRANERTEWIFRLKQEYKVSAFSFFVTLTYDDAHIPLDFSVKKRDVQLFLKRFRKRLGKIKCRYYIVSEYGDRTHRPHYHGLFFFEQTFENKKQLYDDITESWQNGFCDFGDVEEGSIVYCTKYCLKRCEVPEGREKPFRLMSKMNGGIGANYIDQMGVFHTDSRNYSVAFDNGQRYRMPRYYKTLFQKANPDYLRVKQEMSDRLYYQQSQESMKDFSEFCKKHHFSDLQAACEAYNEKQKKKFATREELIIKHTKKQRL